MTPSTLKVISANQSFYQTAKVTAKEIEGKFIYSIGNHASLILLHFIYCKVILFLIRLYKLNNIIPLTFPP